MRPCYCGHRADRHMKGPPWPHSSEVSPDRVMCTVSSCPCDGYEAA